MTDQTGIAPRDTLVRTAIVLTIVGLLCMLVFLIRGFDGASVGIGVFLGMPLTLAGIATYAVAVVRDLRQRGAL